MTLLSPVWGAEAIPAHTGCHQIIERLGVRLCLALRIARQSHSPVCPNHPVDSDAVDSDRDTRGTCGKTRIASMGCQGA